MTLPLAWLFLALFVGADVALAKVLDASDLECSFDTPCRWFNGTNGLEDTVDWQTALAIALGAWNNLPMLGFSKNSTGTCLDEQVKSNRAAKIAFSAECAESQSLTFMATTKSDKDVYSYAVGNVGTTAWMVSQEIPKQIGAGILSFSYWKSKNPPAFRICGRKPPGYPNPLDCDWYNGNSQYQGQTWVQDRVIIPPSDGPFEIVIVAQFTDANSFVAIDDLQYSASFGNGATLSEVPNLSTVPFEKSIDAETTTASAGQPSSKTLSTKLQVIVDTRKCPQIACDFDKSMCQYLNVPGGANWRRHNGRLGSSGHGIVSDLNGEGGYTAAFQQTAQPSSFTLSSPRFITVLPGVLTFNFYLSGETGRIRLCQNKLENCTLVAENDEFETNPIGWRAHELPLAAGFHQLFFVADRLRQDFIAAIDNTQVYDKTKTFELECFRA